MGQGPSAHYNIDMDLNFVSDPDLIPKPREELRIEHLEAVLLEDGRRLRLEVRLTPFTPRDRPSLSIQAYYPDGSELADISVIETMNHHMAFIIHIRRDDAPAGECRFEAALYFIDEPVQHRAALSYIL